MGRCVVCNKSALIVREGVGSLCIDDAIRDASATAFHRPMIWYNTEYFLKKYGGR